MPFFFSSDKGRPCGGSKLREARQEWKVFAKRKAQPPYEKTGLCISAEAISVI